MRIPPLITYIFRRLMITILVLASISFIAFWMAYLLPGDPVTSRYPHTSKELKAEVRKQMGLDQPLPIQYWRFLQSVFKGDFGSSFNTGNKVSEDFREKIPATVELALFSFLLAILVGVPTGIIAATYRNQFWDNIMRLFSISTLSIPSFWLGIVLIYILYFNLHVVPMPIGRLGFSYSPPERITGFYILDAILRGNWRLSWAAFKQLALPAFVLGVAEIAPISRITRSAMSDSLQEDYILFARALGIPEREVVLRDAFRGSLVSILTIIGYMVGFTFAGSAMVETVFAWPGLGRYAVIAITTSDMAPITSCILLVAVGVAFANLIVDVAYAFIDPRIRYEYTK